MSYINIDKFHDKKGIILDFVKQAGNELNEFLHSMEEDESISDDQYAFIEHCVDKVFTKLNAIHDELYFS